MAMNPRLLRPRASGFNPKSIAGLSLWLDGADSSTITISTGVSVWADKSGNGRNAAQATGSKQPAYNATINGKSVVTFQGTDDTMQIGANAAFNANSQTLIIVARQTASANHALWFKADSNSAEGVIMRYRAFDDFWPYQRNDNSAETLRLFPNTPTVARVYAAVLQPNSQAGFVNGGVVSPTGIATAAHTYDNNSGPWLGSRRDVGEYLAGDIAEVLHWNRALTVSERQAVETYLGRKWNIAVTSIPAVINADAQDWIVRVYANGGTVSASTASAVNTFCDAIDTAGIRDRFYRLNLFAGTGLNACLVPLYRGQSRTGTQYGNTTDTNNGPFVSGDYNETGSSAGLLGAATKYLNTGVKANDLTQTDRHLSVVADASSLGLSSQYSIGGDNFGAGGNYYWGILAGSTAGNMMVRAQASATNSTQFSVTGKPHIILSGNGSAAVYRNGSSVVTGPAGAFTAPAQDIWVLGLNRAGSLADKYDGRISSYSIGLAFTASQALSYYNAVSAFQTAMSRI